MDASKLISLVENTRKIKKQQDEAQLTLHKLIYAIARQHLRENEVKQTISDWSATKDALDYLLQLRPTTGSRHRYTTSMRPTHIRASDLKPVRVRRTPTGNFSIFDTGRRKTLDVIDEDQVARNYISLTVDEEEA